MSALWITLVVIGWLTLGYWAAAMDAAVYRGSGCYGGEYPFYYFIFLIGLIGLATTWFYHSYVSGDDSRREAMRHPAWDWPIERKP